MSFCARHKRKGAGRQQGGHDPSGQRGGAKAHLLLVCPSVRGAHIPQQGPVALWCAGIRLDDAGLRQTANGPIPIGNEGWGGLLLAVVMLTAELQESGPVGFEEEDPFAEEPDEAEETETEEKEPL